AQAHRHRVRRGGHGGVRRQDGGGSQGALLPRPLLGDVGRGDGGADGVAGACAVPAPARESPLSAAPRRARGDARMRRSCPRQMSSLEAIVAYVREFLAREGLDEDAASDLDLVLEELFTNLVKYGRGARGDVEIELECGVEGITAQLREHDAEPFD